MKMNKVITSISLFLVATLLIASCGGKEEEPTIIGKWSMTNGALEFKEGGVFVGRSGETKTWELSDDGKKLTIRDEKNPNNPNLLVPMYSLTVVELTPDSVTLFATARPSASMLFGDGDIKEMTFNRVE